MRHTFALALIVGWSGFLASATAQPQDAGIVAVGDLAKVNGQALACQELSVAAKAKKLMLAHAPKLQRYGSAFEEGTNQAYLEQTRSAQVCPNSQAFDQRLETLAQRLQAALPVGAESGR